MSTQAPASNAQPTQSRQKGHELITSTIRSNKWGYVHLKLVPNNHTTHLELDNLQAKLLCTSALTQFLGISGKAMPIDILKVERAEFWIRLQAQDLPRFNAAVSATQELIMGDERCSLCIIGCSEWLGALVNQDSQPTLWT